MIKFQCDNCGEKFGAPEDHAGKKGKCPKCKNVVVVPGPDDIGSVKGRSALGANSGVCGIDSSLFDIPQKAETAEESIAQQHTTDGFSQGVRQPDESIDTEQTQHQDTVVSTLPWLIDLFLYPCSVGGMIRLVSLWLLVFLLCPLLIATVGLGIEYVPLVYFLPVAYLLYYLTECIRDSAGGGRRAPDYWMHPADSGKWDCVSQLFVVVGSIAVCFCPAMVYYIATERGDLVYWLILACGGFFFPMVLLAVVLFDSFNALNPLLIVRSIFSVLIPYGGLVIVLFAGSYLYVRIESRFYNFHPMPIIPLFLRAIQLYIIFVAVGLLGRFYRRYEGKLNWEV